jgi:hypothetical protein
MGIGPKELNKKYTNTKIYPRFTLKMQHGGANSIDGCGWSRVNQAEGVKDIKGVAGSQ